MIVKIQQKFQDICDANSDIATFVFDDGSILNSLVANSWPVCLLKIPQKAEIEDHKKFWEVYDISFCLTTPRHQDETDSLATQYDSLKDLCGYIIDELTDDPQLYQLKSGVGFEYGHDADNNSNVVVLATFRLRVFDCRTYTAPQYVLLENGDLLLLENGDYLILG